MSDRKNRNRNVWRRIVLSVIFVIALLTTPVHGLTQESPESAGNAAGSGGTSSVSVPETPQEQTSLPGTEPPVNAGSSAESQIPAGSEGGSGSISDSDDDIDTAQETEETGQLDDPQGEDTELKKQQEIEEQKALEEMMASVRLFQSQDGVDWETTSAADLIAKDQSYAKKILVFDGMGNMATGAPWAADMAGLRAALAYIKDNGVKNGRGTWLLYIGGTVADSAATAGSAADLLSQATANVDTLVITGIANDPIDNTPAASAIDRNTLTVGTTVNFQCNVILRNINHNFLNVYMNGHDLTLGGGSWQTAASNYYGGAASGDVTGNANIVVNSTGEGQAAFTGGNYTGTFNGNVSITINNSSPAGHINVWGAGRGTATSPANLNGTATTTINGLNTGTTGLGGLHSYVGGVMYGDITGKITNTIKGAGKFAIEAPFAFWSDPEALSYSQFIGGSYYGNIGTTAQAPIEDMELSRMELAYTDNYIIKNNIDTSAWSWGRGYFIGGNENGGTVRGNVSNIVKAGDNNKGSFATFSGFSGNESDAGVGANPTGPWNAFTYNTTNGAFGGAEQALALARTSYKMNLYGNVTNIILSGCISDAAGAGYYRALGWGGYVEGSAYSVVGKEGLVYQSFNDATYGSNTTHGADTVAGYKGDITKQYGAAAARGENVLGRLGGFDLVGGGGQEDEDHSIFINGNTTLVQANVKARWTYGGSFGGNQIGDSRNELWRGIVDTLEGSGYQSEYHAGNSKSIVHGGEVDWFLTGGGWSDHYLSGGGTVIVEDNPRTRVPTTDTNGDGVVDFRDEGAPVTGTFNGKSGTLPAVVVNASMGGGYMDAVDNYMTGDTHMYIYGGDFSGSAIAEPINGFCTSGTMYGTIFGSANMTLDFRGNEYGFAIEAGDAISGGRPYGNVLPTLGTNGTQKIVLNVFSDQDSNVNLNGLNIYGDASTTSAPSRIGKITMNINAPGANIGNVFATNYSNIENGKLLRDVDINLVSAGSITGLSATNPNDDITNNVASASADVNKYAEIHVGAQPEPADWNKKVQGVWPLEDWETDKTTDGYPHKIRVVEPESGTAYGIRNFTSMTIDKRLLIAESGNILNGGKATDANHYNTYQSFGDIRLTDGSGLGIQEDDADFMAGKLTVAGKGYVTSPGGKNQITFSNIVFVKNGANEGELVWLKSGDAVLTKNLKTNYFGVTEGYPVITINPTQSLANKITPSNFSGMDLTTGKTYVGDSDTHFSAAESETTVASGYAVAIPGSKYDWNVVSGEGTISYHMDGNFTMGIGKPSNGEALHVYGTTPMDTPTKSGSLVILSGFVNTANGPVKSLPRFTFTPDEELGEWVENLEVWRSDKPSSMQGANPYFSEGEQSIETYQTAADRIRVWDANKKQSANKDLDFDISVSYKNKVELYAESVILKEKEAAKLFGYAGMTSAEAAANVVKVTNAKGRPFFTSDISDEKIAELKKPLGEEPFRKTSFTYGAGTVAPNKADKVVTITVVPDDAAVSKDKKAVLIADDATVLAAVARGITAQSGAANDEQNLDYYTGALVIDAISGDSYVPALSNPEGQDAQAIVETIKASGAGDIHKLAYSYSYGEEKLSKNAALTVVGGTISGITFKEDFDDKDGIYQASKEKPLSGVKVILLGADGNPMPGVVPVVTGEDGKYEFANLDEGTYGVRFSLPDIWYVYTTLSAGRKTGIEISFDSVYQQQRTQDSGYYQSAPVDSGIDGGMENDPAIILTVLAIILTLALFAAVWSRRKVVKTHD